MRMLIIPVMTTLGLLAAPAFAQSSNSSSDSKSSGSPTPSAMQMEQNLKQDLTKAGYTDVNVMPGSFLVQAKDSKGHSTEMMVSPGSVTEITAMNTSSSSTPSSSSGGSSSSSGSSAPSK